MLKRVPFKIISAVLLLAYFNGAVWAASDRQFSPYKAAPGVAIGTWQARTGYQRLVDLRNIAKARRNDFFGNLGEGMMDSFLATNGFRTVNANIGAGGRQGLDGIYFRYNKNGDITKVIVGESKWNTSQLNPKTHQFESEWIEKRLRQMSKRFDALNRKVKSNNVVRVSDPKDVIKNSSHSTLTVSKGKKIEVWVDSKTGKLNVYSKSDISNEEISQALEKHAKDLRHRAATGNYKATLARTQITKDGHIMTALETYEGAYSKSKPHNETIFDYDPANGTLTKTVNKYGDDGKLSTTKTTKCTKDENASTYNKYRRDIKRAVKDAMAKDIKSQYVKQGIAEKEAQVMAEREAQKRANKMTELEIAKEYEKLNRFQYREAGIQMLKAGAYAAAAAAIFDAVVQMCTTGNIDAIQTLKISVISAGSASAGYASYIALKQVLNSSAAQNITNMISDRIGSALGQTVGKTIATNLSGVASAGGSILIASAVFSLGAWALGLSDGNNILSDLGNGALSAALWGGGTYIAGLGIQQAIIWGVSTWGTTAGGTAIATLAGAAKTNAILAWLGGGAISAGGTGVAGGAALLGSVTPVIGWVVAAGSLLYVGYTALNSWWHSGDGDRVLAGRLDYIYNRYR